MTRVQLNLSTGCGTISLRRKHVRFRPELTAHLNGQFTRGFHHLPAVPTFSYMSPLLRKRVPTFASHIPLLRYDDVS